MVISTMHAGHQMVTAVFTGCKSIDAVMKQWQYMHAAQDSRQETGSCLTVCMCQQCYWLCCWECAWQWSSQASDADQDTARVPWEDSSSPSALVHAASAADEQGLPADGLEGWPCTLGPHAIYA